MKTRKATAADLQELQTLFSDTIAGVCAGDYSNDQLQVWISSVENKDRWLEKIARQFFIVAEIGKSIVGYGSLEGGSYLDFMYVHKDYQGRRIATTILSELEHEALRGGFSEITSDVSKTARPFFEKNGFVIVKENVNRIRGVEIINFKMVKTL